MAEARIGERLKRVDPKVGLAFQAALIATSIGLAASPPATGTMLIAPLLPATTATTLRWAFANGALLAGPGPYDGAVVVFASRARLFRAALSNGAVLVAAEPAGCSSIMEISDGR